MGYFIEAIEPYWTQSIIDYKEDGTDTVDINPTDRKIYIDGSIYRIMKADKEDNKTICEIDEDFKLAEQILEGLEKQVIDESYAQLLASDEAGLDDYKRLENKI